MKTDLFLTRDQVPVVYEPRFQLFWDFYFHLHSIDEGLLLGRVRTDQTSDHFTLTSRFRPTLVLTLSTVGSTRALFFRGGCVRSPPELVPSPGPGAADTWQVIECQYILFL